MEEEKKEFNAKAFAVILIIAIIAIVVGIYFLISSTFEKNKKADTTLSNSSSETQTTTNATPAETKPVVAENEYAVKDNNLSKFDLSFLKFENEEGNKIYSPLSIKYAFKMLEEGTTGEAHNQIASIIEAYNLTEYTSNEKMALGNAFFIRDSFQDSVKESYINALKTKYNADIVFDTFETAENINLWVKGHTLNLIPDLMSDDEVGELDFALVNALGIDMEWKHKFFKKFEEWDNNDYTSGKLAIYNDDEHINSGITYNHARRQDSQWQFGWDTEPILYAKKFYNDQKVSSMKVIASLNNYDPITTLGEDAIREEVYKDFHDWALAEGKYEGKKYGTGQNYTEWFSDDYSEENIKAVFDKWFDYGIIKYSYNSNPEENSEYGYLNELSKNYGRVDYTTDFSIFVNDDVKVFAKDLEEVDGTTLQYIGIMPQRESLASFIENIDSTTINRYISSLKELKLENFKPGYLTYIHGYIPKFTFEYDLNLKEDLGKMGVTDVFEQGKADLTKMTDDESIYITDAKHKANIEFTQDGIKAAAATYIGGGGGGDSYDYFIEMPTEDIDITFDKPYMFLIRDKQTGETWFVGTVYEPLSEEREKEISPYGITDAWDDRDVVPY